MSVLDPTTKEVIGRFTAISLGSTLAQGNITSFGQDGKVTIDVGGRLVTGTPVKKLD